MSVMPVVSHTHMTPLRFLERSAAVYPDKVAIVHGDRRTSYREFAGEATRLARALQASGIEPGDRVAYLCPNIPELLIAHFAVPLAGANGPVRMRLDVCVARNPLRSFAVSAFLKCLQEECGFEPVQAEVGSAMLPLAAARCRAPT